MARSSVPRTSPSSAPAASTPAGVRGAPRGSTGCGAGNSSVRRVTRTTKAPLPRGFRMRRRGLEPPPTNGGPAPQPCHPGVRHVLCVHIVHNSGNLDAMDVMHDLDVATRPRPAAGARGWNRVPGPEPSELGPHVSEHCEDAPVVVLGRRKTQLVEDRADVLLHSGLRDGEALSDRLVRAAFGDQPEYLALAR